MSTKVTINNFQSVKHAEFEIDGFTVVVGQNNIGKSALIRAMDKALTNAVGSSWIRKGERIAEVRIRHGKNDIEWKKGDKTLYKVNGETFTALNREIPKPMAEAGFGRMQVGDRMVNPILASQFKELFLLDEPGTVVTEILADLYDLNVLNDADSDLQRDLKAQKALFKARDADLKAAREELAKFEGFEEIKQAAEVMATTEKKCGELREQIAELAEYEGLVKEAEVTIGRLKAVAKVRVPAPDACEVLAGECTQMKDWEDKIASMARVVKALKPAHSVVVPDPAGSQELMEQAAEVARYYDAVFKAGMVVETLSGVPSIDIASAQAKAEGLEDVVSAIATIKAADEAFLASARATKSARDAHRQAVTELEGVQKEYDAIDVCPLCERPMHEHKNGEHDGTVQKDV